jgi:hypothetical protein
MKLSMTSLFCSVSSTFCGCFLRSFIMCSMCAKNEDGSWAWWCTPLIPALGRQRQADFWVQSQPGLQSEFQDSQDYTERPCLKKPKKKKKKIKKKITNRVHVRFLVHNSNVILQNWIKLHLTWISDFLVCMETLFFVLTDIPWVFVFFVLERKEQQNQL